MTRATPSRPDPMLDLVLERVVDVITQDRDVPREWVGREPIYAWEAKVYALI